MFIDYHAAVGILAHCIIAVTLLFSQAVVADVTITRLANEGVIIDDGSTRIMIDGLVVERYALYGGLPPQLEQQFNSASGLFENIDLALASHRHHDHNQPEFACKFLKASPQTKLITSMQVIDLIRERCRPLVRTSTQVEVIDPQYEHPAVIRMDTAEISTFLLSHGTGKYARLQNFGHRVDIDGVQILHIGDAAMNVTDFEIARFDSESLDVALIPFWFFQPGPGMAVIEQFMDAPHKLAVHIPPDEMAEVSEYLGENYPEVLILAEPGESVVISSSPRIEIDPPPQ